MPALLRMPLLYVDGSSLGSDKGNVFGNNDGNVDAILEQVVSRAIREVVYGEESVGEPIILPFRGLELQGEDNSVLYAVGDNVNDKSQDKQERKEPTDAEDEEDGVFFVEDWPSASETAAETNGPSGWEMVEKLVHKIQTELEGSYGLKTCWPLDKPQGEEMVIEYDDDPMIAAIKQKQRKWRPRVPFVRLPKDFYKDLEADAEKRIGNNNSGDKDDDDEPPSMIDMGFDGISPLFWYEAWGERDILSPPGARMRSLAVYRRMVPGGGEAESSFYVPNSSDNNGPPAWKGSSAGSVVDDSNNNSMELPVGDTKLASRERREMAKAMDRLGEVEQRAEREWEEGKARLMDDMDDDRNIEKGSLLEEEDSFAPFDVGMEMGAVTVDGDAAYSAPWSERGAEEGDSIIDTSSKQVDEENLPEERSIEPIEKALQSDSPKTPPQQKFETKPRKDLPSIEDNPIFQRLWKRQSQVTSKGQNTAVALDGTPPTEDAPLPPYPSDAHFTGAWRVVSSPLEAETASIEDSESKSSDNFIFRVDGQVFGGPVLDAQYQQKAAGGQWKMFQAVRKTSDRNESEDGSAASPATQTRLRIRLLVPPKKDLALVMEGEVTRLIMPGAGDAATSSSDGWMMAGGGMLDGMLENLDDGVGQSSQSGAAKGGDGLLYCAGEAWMEDAEGGANRKKIGSFSLMKLKAIDRKNLIYTVDVSRSTAEEEDGENDERKD